MPTIEQELAKTIRKVAYLKSEIHRATQMAEQEASRRKKLDELVKHYEKKATTCHKKKRYSGPFMAKIALEKITLKNLMDGNADRNVGLQSFYCENCASYHIGHRLVEDKIHS
jgi:hypothetical protein